MLIDMIHDNHGEPPFKTRYRDPAVLRARGYEAIVIPDALAALPGAAPAAAHDPVATRSAPPAPRKPSDLEAAIDQHARAALDQGMRVFFYGDALLLPLAVVAQRPTEFCCDDGSGRLCPAKPAVFEALRDQVLELFDRWPDAAGLVMRTGEVYPEATPHMTGSALHLANCPRCRELSLEDRLVRFIQAMHDVVIGECRKTYIHRAWQPAVPGLPNMHDDPTVYRAIAARVPQSPELRFSFKFTRGDFRRTNGGGGREGGGDFNPCLLADDRPKWIEFQCEREYEGKGAFPNYQGPSWRRFLEQLRRDAGGLSEEDLRQRFGIWGWSRGGGWGGPYVQREEWIDVNVRALADLYRRPEADPAEVATSWVGETFNIAESSPPAPAIAELLAISAPTVHQLLYVSALAPHPDDDLPWLKDDLLDVEAIYTTAGRVVDLGVAGEAIAEKREALAGVDRIRQLFDIAAPDLPNPSQVRDLTNALAYFHSFAGTVVHLFVGFTRFHGWIQSGRTDGDLVQAASDHLAAAQAQWQLHTQRHSLLPGAPSMFHEQMLWERTNACLAEMEDE